jgi:DNA-binding transcriptional LysR family regulator
MTLEQLRMLTKIAEAGGVLAAAEALHKTQPTVSVAIRKLEEEFGLPLLARDGYRASLTPAGEALCRQAQVVLKQGEVLTGMARHLARGNEPEIRLAIEAVSPLPPILGILRGCEQKFPDTRFNLIGDTLWGALERLQAGEADLAITPWLEENLEFESFPVASVNLTTVASPAFRQALPDRTLELDDLKNSVQVVVRDSSRKPRARSFGFLPEGRHWYVTDHLTKKEIILAGMGWGRLQEHLIADELRSGRLVPLEINNYPLQMTVDICVARRMGQPVGPVAATLWEDFRKSGRTGA